MLFRSKVAEAWRLGLALRLALSLSAGAKDILRRVELAVDGGKLRLKLPGSLEAFAGEQVQRRLGALADALDKKAVIQVGKR